MINLKDKYLVSNNIFPYLESNDILSTKKALGVDNETFLNEIKKLDPKFNIGTILMNAIKYRCLSTSISYKIRSLITRIDIKLDTDEIYMELRNLSYAKDIMTLLEGEDVFVQGTNILISINDASNKYINWDMIWLDKYENARDRMNSIYDKHLNTEEEVHFTMFDPDV